LPDQPGALFVGVLERYKNVAGLAEAWRLAAPQLPQARLRIVGRGREAPIVARLAADFPNCVELVPRLEPAQVSEALDASRLLVLPSLSAGLPTVAMEGFARGRPVFGVRGWVSPGRSAAGGAGLGLGPQAL